MNHQKNTSLRAFILALVLGVVFCPAASTVLAHELTRGVGTQSTFAFFSDHVEVELNFGISASVGYQYLQEMDQNLDDYVDDGEAEAFLNRKGPELVEKLDLRINGRKITLAIERHWNLGIKGRISAFPFDCFFLASGKIPPALPAGGWWMRYHDGTFVRDTSSQYCWVRENGHGEFMSFRIVEPGNPESVPIAGMRTIGRDLIAYFSNDKQISPVMFQAPEEIKVPTNDELCALDLGPEWSDAHMAAAKAAPAMVAAPPAATPGMGPPANTGSAPAGGAPTASGERSRSGEDDSSIQHLIDFVRDLQEGKLSWWKVVLGILVAMWFGAGHALGPGHGKAMVSAYLAGTQGRLRDAIVLGVVVTFSHTFSVFLLGLGLAYAIEHTTEKAATDTYKNWCITGFSLFSGVLLSVLGATLLRYRWKHRKHLHEHHHHGLFGHSHPHLGEHHHEHEHEHEEHDHEHDHEHEESFTAATARERPTQPATSPGHAHEEHDHEHAHDHDHGHEHEHEHEHTQRTSWRDLILLGISGGIVPCPAGLTVMLVGAHEQSVWIALLIFTFFSLGLGGLLVGIGVALVLGKDKIFNLVGSERRRNLISTISIASAFLILCLGLYFVWDSIVKDPQSIGQMLSALGDWIQRRG